MLLFVNCLLYIVKDDVQFISGVFNKRFVTSSILAGKYPHARFTQLRYISKKCNVLYITWFDIYSRTHFIRFIDSLSRVLFYVMRLWNKIELNWMSQKTIIMLPWTVNRTCMSIHIPSAATCYLLVQCCRFNGSLWADQFPQNEHAFLRCRC